MSTYTGTNNNDSWTVVNPGTFTLDGLGGVDTLYLGTSLRSSYTITQSSDGAVHVDSVSGASGLLHATLYNMEKLVFASGHDTLDLTTYFGASSSPTVYTGTVQNDNIAVGAGSATVDGLGGLNTVTLSEAASHFRLQPTATGFTLTRTDGTGTITLTNIQRLSFSDQKMALDLNGNAGAVAKILGAVFGAASVSNPAYVGIGLSLLDSGQYNATTLIGFALDTLLGQGASAKAVVDTLYRNVVGVAPDAATESTFVALLNNQTYTAATLGAMAAATDLNLANIHLTGLSQTGLNFS